MSSKGKKMIGSVRKIASKASLIWYTRTPDGNKVFLNTNMAEKLARSGKLVLCCCKVSDLQRAH